MLRLELLKVQVVAISGVEAMRHHQNRLVPNAQSQVRNSPPNSSEAVFPHHLETDFGQSNFGQSISGSGVSWWGLKGWGPDPEKGGARKVGARRVGRPKISGMLVVFEGGCSTSANSTSVSWPKSNLAEVEHMVFAFFLLFLLF